MDKKEMDKNWHQVLATNWKRLQFMVKSIRMKGGWGEENYGSSSADLPAI